MGEIVVVAWMLFAIYILVLLMICADLWSGLRKAKKRKEIRTSIGLRRTVDKVAKYYNVLIALTFIDCMQMAGIWYLDKYYDWHVPIFPIITMAGAIGIGLIEVKSIFEKAEDKDRYDYQQVGKLLVKLAGSKTDTSEMAKVINEYINKPDEKS